MSASKATAILDGQSVAFKNELLFQHGINFNELSIWQRRGVGLYWEEYHKQGYNPVQAKEVLVTRRRIKVDEELPMKDAYGEFILSILNAG
jgi:tRNA(His) 5'-end guanylyltransferase